MSEKQSFNKDIQNRQIAEKRRERWMSRKILTEILETIRLQKNDANWILYQVFNKETLSYKSKIKIWNHLMRAGYDLAKKKPQKENKIFSYKEAWREYKGTTIYPIQTFAPSFKEHTLYQRLDTANEQLNEADELLKEIYTHITEKAARTVWETKKDCKKFTEILDKIKKRVIDEKENKKMAI